MVRQGFLTALIVAACFVAACRSTEKTHSQSVKPSTDRDRLVADAGAASSTSPADYRSERTRKAMRGVTYDTGLAVVDAEYAASFNERGDRSAADAEYERGEELLAGNTFSAALAAFTRAVVIKPDVTEYYNGLGRALTAKRKDAEAEAAYRTGLTLAPNDSELRYLLGDILQRRGKLPDSIAEFEQVLTQNPDYGPAHRRLAVLYYYVGRLDESRVSLAAAMDAGEPTPGVLPALLDGELPQADVAFSGRGAPGPQVRIDANGGEFAANETSIASSDVNPLEVVAAWNDWRDSYGYTEVVRMGVSVSQDGGQSWNDFTVRPPAAYQSDVEGDPMTCYDNRTGTLWVGAISFSYNGGVYVARKTPGAAAFEDAVMARTTSSADKCWMAAGPKPGTPNSTAVYIAYNEGLLKSVDMGDTWTGPSYLNYGIGLLPRVGPGGEVYVAYWDLSDGMMLQRSYNGGTSFTTHRMATRMDVWGTQESTRFPGEFRVPPFAYLAVDPNDGTLYCVYFDTTNYQFGNYNVDLYFCKSTNDGTSWTSPVKINSDGFPPGDQFFPWLEVDADGVLHMVFYNSRRRAVDDDDEHGFFDASYSTSSDGGDTWTEYYLTSEPFDSYYDGLPRNDQFMGDYLGLAVGGGRVYPCYVSTQNGDTDTFVNVITAATIPGDLDGDGDVDLSDLAALLSVYNLCEGDEGYLPAADFDESGCINLSDLAKLLSVYGS